MTDGLGGTATRLGIRKVLLMIGAAYFAFRSMWAIIKCLDRNHWSAALFYAYPLAMWLVFLIAFLKLPDPKVMREERRESLKKGVRPAALTSPLMVAPFALIMGAAAQYITYGIASHRDPHHADRNILIALLAALVVACTCFILIEMIGDRNRRRRSSIPSQAGLPGGRSTEMGRICIVRDVDGWRNDGTYQVEIDGSSIGSLRRGRHREVEVKSGRHTLRITKGWQGSPAVGLLVEKGVTQVWECGPTPPTESREPEATRSIWLRSLSETNEPADAALAGD